MRLSLLLPPLLLGLAACGQSAPPEQSSSEETVAPSAKAAPEKAYESAAASAVEIAAPAGDYAVDRNHAYLGFSINHLGLSNYQARFTDYTVDVKLDPETIGDSSVKVNIKADSVAADYPGDYKAGHKSSPYETWLEDLSKSDKFFNSEKHPEITFESTRIEDSGDGSLTIVGDLTLLGQTHPVTLDAEVVGAVAAHPFTNVGAMGFSVTGTFKRSEFAMNHLLDPPLIGDEVTLHFEGEFHQVVKAPTVETAAK